MGVGVCHSTQMEIREQLSGIGSLSTMQVLGIELGMSGLAAGAFSPLSHFAHTKTEFFFSPFLVLVF